ncbi:MAG: copper oxidase, partial [Gammaproteobacteria bacterium]
GKGPFGGIGMGGMFTVMKVRPGLARGDYSDPGWYKHPAGTVAYEWTGQLPEPARSSDAGRSLMPATSKPDVELQVRKPSGHAEH